MSYPPMIHTITVKTRSLASFNDLGEPVYTEPYTTTYNSIPARVERWEPSIKYNPSGQHPEAKIIVYFPPSRTGLQSEQVIEAVNVPGYANGQIIGRIKEVVPALLGVINKINHYEAILEDVS